MKFHFIIIEHNSYEFLNQFINSISNLPNTKITIFDNNSNYNVRDEFNDNIEVITCNENLGYGKAINIVAKKSNSEYLFICNSDLIFLEDTFEKINKFVNENPKVELFGIQQIFPNNTIQYSYGVTPSIKELLSQLFFIQQIERRYYFNKKVKKVDYIDGAFMIIKSSVFNKINGFDEDYFFYSEDADICYRARKQNIPSFFVPFITIIHHRGASSQANMLSRKNAELFINGRKLFINKHHSKTYGSIYFKLFKFNINFAILFNLIAYKIFKSKNKLSKIENNKLLLNLL